MTGVPLFGLTCHKPNPPVPEESNSPKKEGHQEKPKKGRPPLFPEKPLPQTLSREESDKQFQRNTELSRELGARFKDKRGESQWSI